MGLNVKYRRSCLRSCAYFNLEWIALLNCKLKCVAILVVSETEIRKHIFRSVESWPVDSRFHLSGASNLERLPTLIFFFKQACLLETQLEFENVQVSTLDHILKIPLPALQIDHKEPTSRIEPS